MALNFYAKMYDVSRGIFIDDTPKIYGLAVCTDPAFPDYGNRLDNVVSDSIAFPENNIMSAMSKFLGSTSWEIRFCLTDGPNDNYVFLFNGDTYAGGFYYNGKQYANFFGSNAPNGSRIDSLSVVSTATLEPGTKTGIYGYSDVRENFYVYGNGILTDESSAALVNLINIAPGPETDLDPYEPGGTTEPGGGEGDFDDTTTPIDFPPLPQTSASDTGFISLFNPSTEQLRELANYMWSDLFDIEGWKKIFADPMDAILGLSIVPVSVPGGTTRPVTVGNISTGVNLTVAASQYVSVDCGAINVNEYWGGYLDYDPHTKAEIYLPYVGTHAIAVDDIMGKSVHVVYHVDILSGACCAYVKCGGSVLYSFVGQCSCSIPITGSDWTNVINGALSIAGTIGSMVATGGASAPMAVGTIASAAVNSLKPNVEKSGSMGGMGGMLGIQTPYLILTRPRQALPANQSHYTGYPSFMTVMLGDCNGYTEIEHVHLEKIPATRAEISEIEALLKGGVIF